jgi:hypothetical protein
MPVGTAPKDLSLRLLHSLGVASNFRSGWASVPHN